MYVITLKAILCWLCLAVTDTIPVVRDNQNVNNRPIIGLVVKPTRGSPEGTTKYGDEFVEAMYVKYLEAAGARVVPIRGKQTTSYYEEMFKYINGVLFPGGGIDLVNNSYIDIGRFMYKKAIEANLKGDYFPIWGTCLGFELLSVLTAGENLLKNTDSENLTLPLKFTKGSRSSRLFHQMPDDLKVDLATQPITQNNHELSLLLEVFKASELLTNFYDVLATSFARDGTEFVAAFEAKDFPFYGSQFHPEKSIFKWHTNKAINHGRNSVLVSQYFADFFVNEARRSMHHFDSAKHEALSLIENYMDMFVPNPTFKETYYFNYTKHTLFFESEQETEKHVHRSEFIFG